MVAISQAAASTHFEIGEPTSARYKIVRQHTAESVNIVFNEPVLMIGQTAQSAIDVRRTWMQQMGLSPEEIAEYCDESQYPADMAEELLSLDAMWQISEREHGPNVD